MEEIKNAQEKIKKSKATLKLNNLIKVYEYIQERNDDGVIVKERMLEAGWVNIKLINIINYYDYAEFDNIRYVKVIFEQEPGFNFATWWGNHKYYLKKSDLEEE